jgi:hypothetical protein
MFHVIIGAYPSAARNSDLTAEKSHRLERIGGMILPVVKIKLKRGQGLCRFLAASVLMEANPDRRPSGKAYLERDQEKGHHDS